MGRLTDTGAALDAVVAVATGVIMAMSVRGRGTTPGLSGVACATGSIAPVTRISGDGSDTRERTLRVLLYSDDVETRSAVRLAVGKRPARDLPRVEWVECATSPAVIAQADAGGFDVLVLDGEATPTGGMGLCRQLKNEIYDCPPVLVLTGRPQDAWLAAWSLADAAVPHPLDPIAVTDALADLARQRLGTVQAG